MLEPFAAAPLAGRHREMAITMGGLASAHDLHQVEPRRRPGASCTKLTGAEFHRYRPGRALLSSLPVATSPQGVKLREMCATRAG